MRLGQLIYNAMKSSKSKDVFYVEDDDLENYLLFFKGGLFDMRRKDKKKPSQSYEKIMKDLRDGYEPMKK